jgi:hypothetical protein
MPKWTDAPAEIEPKWAKDRNWRDDPGNYTPPAPPEDFPAFWDNGSPVRWDSTNEVEWTT